MAASRDKLRLGVVGAGRWCRFAHLPSLKGQDRAEVVAVASRTGAGAEAAAADLDGARVVPGWRELVAAEDVDALLVTSPADSHAEVGLAALERGLPVLCEAPLAMTSADGAALCAAAERAGVVGAYCLPRPFLYGGARVQELLAEGAVGEPRTAALTLRGNPWLLADPAVEWRARRDAVPPLLVGVCVGVLRELLGDVSRVQARLERLAPSPAGPHAPAFDYFAALWDFASGVRATLDAGVSPLPPPGSGLTVHGSAGSLLWDWTVPGRVLVARAGDAAWEDASVEVAADLAGLFPFTRDFVDAVLDGRPPRVSLEAGLHELRVIEACERSAESGAWVDVPRP